MSDASIPDTPEPQTHSWIVELRGRLDQPPPVRLPPSDVRKASVLVPLYVDAGQLWTLLTKRTDHLPTHKGQVAFPGGSLEGCEDPWACALRETYEEIGIEPERVLKLGELDEAETPAGFRVRPCVGVVPVPVETTIDEGEIDEVFSVPLQILANPDLVEDRAVKIDGVERVLRIYHVGRHQIWGLTSRILQNLLIRLGMDGATMGS